MVVSLIGSILDKVVDGIREVPALRRDQKRKAILRNALEEERIQWRSIGTLARLIGASEERTRELLISIGARASAGGGNEVWGLISRVGSG